MLDKDRIQGSDFERYDKSELWSIHELYFKNIGLKAWSSGALPFAGVTSYSETQKKVLLLVENLKQLGYENHNKPIKVLEIGAGSGEFAKNFIYALENFCHSLDLNFHERLEYYVTDYAETTIDEVRKHKKLKKFPNIKYFQFDVLMDTESSSLRDFFGGFQCICSTYLLDQLPNRVIAKSGNKYYEKYIKLCIEEDFRNNEEIRKKVLKSNKWIKKIKKKFDFRELDLEDSIPKLDFDALEKCFRVNKDESTVIYSYGALEAVKNSMKLLSEDGLLIFSDFNAASRPGVDVYEPCYYGNSLAQPVNFSFLYNYFAENQKIILFEDPIKPLHTMIMCHHSYKSQLMLGASYEKIFKQNIAVRVIFRLLVELKFSIYILLLVSVLYAAYYILSEAAKLPLY